MLIRKNQNKKIQNQAGMPESIILPDMPACSVSVKNNVKTFPDITKNNYHIKSANVICCPQPFSSKVFRYSNI